jgi:hypothetical protein
MLTFWIITISIAFVLGALIGGIGCAAGIVWLWRTDNKFKKSN